LITLAVTGDDVMAWLIGTIIVIAIIWFMIVSPGFRFFAIGLVVLGAFGIYALIQNSEKQTAERQQQRAQQERWTTSAIKTDEISLKDVSLKKGSLYWTLKGVVSNNSQFDLGSIMFLVTIQDCSNGGNCRIIGQETAKTSVGFSDKPLVPAGQLRSFETYSMEFKNMPPAANPTWEYKVTEIRAVR
jgi:membrane protein implicated in regulation of membrane protease activity